MRARVSGLGSGLGGGGFCGDGRWRRGGVEGFGFSIGLAADHHRPDDARQRVRPATIPSA